MKRLLVLLLVISVAALALCGCMNSNADSDSDIDVSSSKEEVSSEIAGITDDRAIEIASEHWGIKNGDKDEKTGYTFAIMKVESGNENIRIDLKWLVNNSTYSTVDSVEIDPATGKIIESENSQPERITDERAIEIGENHWGIRSGDKDEETGFIFAIMVVNSQNENIRVDLKWLVNGSNYSTVDTIELDPFTGEIVSSFDEA